jgi:hypothetical protein
MRSPELWLCSDHDKFINELYSSIKASMALWPAALPSGVIKTKSKSD